MCGIIGLFNNQDAKAKIELALPLLQNRGSDGAGITDGDKLFRQDEISNLPQETKNVLGHTLHAVVGNVAQPLHLTEKENKIFLTANCEIYNWQELAKKHQLNANNDAELIINLLANKDKQEFLEILQQLDGVYAFALWQKNKIFLTRDILGIKPIWYCHNRDDFAFASEKKVLEKLGYLDIKELNPRKLLIYDLETNQLEVINKEFFKIDKEKIEQNKTNKELQQQTELLLDQAINKRIPNKKFGLLFSGGIDSTYLAKYFKDNNYDFTCYTAVLDTEQVVPSDLIAAQQAAKKLGLNLKIKKIKLNEIPDYLKKIIPLIEDSNVVKVGVALTFYLACEMAKQDGCKVIFSGLGSEEIFAGYDRHYKSAEINQECVSGLLKMYERDLYRDDVLTMDNKLELRLPFLDKNLVEHALNIPAEFKINTIIEEDDNRIKQERKISKKILRDIALTKKISKEIALRKKTAAQYGSRFDYALNKLAKQNNFPNKSAYLRSFFPTHNLKLGVLFSSGKDSCYAAYIMKKQNYDLTCLINMKSKNPDSYMFQSAGVEITKLQAEAMNLPLIEQETSGEKELELNDLKLALQKAQNEHKIEGVVTGAVMSVYQRDRIEKICDELGLKIFSPLWHKVPLEEMKELLHFRFEFLMCSISADGLNESWLGKKIDMEMVEKLQQLNEKIGFHVNGEGGEFESLVLNCPLFNKRIRIVDSVIKMENEFTGILKINKAELIDKGIK